MTWKWIERLFPAAEPEPRWMDAHARPARGDLLLELMYHLGNPPHAVPAAERLRAEAAAMRPAEWVQIDDVLRQRMAGWSEFLAPRWVRGPDDVRGPLGYAVDVEPHPLDHAHPDSSGCPPSVEEPPLRAALHHGLLRLRRTPTMAA